MRKPLLAALSVALLLGACGAVRDSRLNPFNWFGGSEETTTDATVVTAPEDRRPLADQIVDMAVEPIPGGAIVRATALPATQGHWNAELVKDEAASTPEALVYRFILLPPLTPKRVSTPQSREVTAAVSLSNIRLQGVRQITVQGLQNARTSRR